MFLLLLLSLSPSSSEAFVVDCLLKDDTIARFLDDVESSINKDDHDGDEDDDDDVEQLFIIEVSRRLGPGVSDVDDDFNVSCSSSFVAKTVPYEDPIRRQQQLSDSRSSSKSHGIIARTRAFSREYRMVLVSLQRSRRFRTVHCLLFRHRYVVSSSSSSSVAAARKEIKRSMLLILLLFMFTKAKRFVSHK
jgi:hypothetical protein